MQYRSGQLNGNITGLIQNTSNGPANCWNGRDQSRGVEPQCEIGAAVYMKNYYLMYLFLSYYLNYYWSSRTTPMKSTYLVLTMTETLAALRKQRGQLKRKLTDFNTFLHACRTEQNLSLANTIREKN